MWGVWGTKVVFCWGGSHLDDMLDFSICCWATQQSSGLSAGCVQGLILVVVSQPPKNFVLLFWGGVDLGYICQCSRITDRFVFRILFCGLQIEPNPHAFNSCAQIVELSLFFVCLGVFFWGGYTW